MRTSASLLARVIALKPVALSNPLAGQHVPEALPETKARLALGGKLQP